MPLNLAHLDNHLIQRRIVIGIIKGDITVGLAGASAPYLATLIKEQTGHYDAASKTWITDNKTANLVAHAILGAVVAELQGNSGLSGGIGAVTGEVAAEFMAKHIYGKDVKDLTEAKKEISARYHSLPLDLLLPQLVVIPAILAQPLLVVKMRLRIII